MPTKTRTKQKVTRAKKGQGLSIPSDLAALGVTTGPNPLPLSECFIYLMGRSKVGKTTFLAGVPRCLILDFGNEAHSIKAQRSSDNNHRVFIRNGEQLNELTKKLVLMKKGNVGTDMYDMIAYDTAREWQGQIEREIIERSDKYDFLADFPHGKGWDMLREVSIHNLTQLRDVGYGIIVTSHLTEKIVNVDGKDTKVVDANVRGSFRDYLYQKPELIATLTRKTDYAQKRVRNRRTNEIEIRDDMTKKETIFQLDIRGQNDAHSGGSRVELDDIITLPTYKDPDKVVYGYDRLDERYEAARQELITKWCGAA